jgi:hypothetical protein
MAQGSKNRTTTGAIKELFRKAVKAITGLDEAEPRPAARRRRGETESGFQMAAKAALQRTAQLPRDAYVTAIAFLSDARDWLSLWHNETGSGEAQNGIQNTDTNHLFPHI